MWKPTNERLPSIEYHAVGRWRRFVLRLATCPPFLIRWSLGGARKMLPTKIVFGTSTPLMRTGVAFMMALILVSAVTNCPAIACPIRANSGPTKSCCHEPKPQQPTSCPRTTIQNCPYLILEKITAATATPVVASVSFHPISPELPALNRRSLSGAEDRLPDSSGLFLRIRVLLI